MLPQAPSGFSNYKRSKKLLVGAVGIEFAVNPTSPADSIALLSPGLLKTQLVERVLWPRCGHFPRARESLVSRDC
jgi:hypothetical protein